MSYFCNFRKNVNALVIQKVTVQLTTRCYQILPLGHHMLLTQIPKHQMMVFPPRLVNR